MLTHLQQYLRAAASRGRTTSHVGPFLVTIDEDTDHPYLNYAIPDDGARPSDADVTALVETFTGRGRIPRLEYLAPTAPVALAALEAAGFAVEDRLQAMTATRAVAVPPPAGYTLVVPQSDADLTAMLGVQNVAYDAPAAVRPAQLRASRASQEAGGIVVALRHEQDGRIVGGGVATPPQGAAFTEVAGIAINPRHRRRGLATALASELTRQALAAGVHTAFLTPRDDEVARLYTRAGYMRTGQMLHVRRD